MEQKTMLVILDGFGINTTLPEQNPIIQATTPTFDRLFAQPHVSMTTFGRVVGLPDGQMGNSEVGHMVIGSGRTLKQSLVTIDDIFAKQEFAKMQEIQGMISYARSHNGRLHLMGIFSDGGVHGLSSHMTRIIGCIPDDIDIFLHLFSDGRDVAPGSFFSDISQLDSILSDQVKIASISGRYHSMDRDTNWDRTSLVYDMMTSDQVPKCHHTIGRYLEIQDEIGHTDEFFTPMRFVDEVIIDGDAVFFTNFRADRARQITQAYIEEDFLGFGRDCLDIHFVSMHQYYSSQLNPTILKSEIPKNTLAEVLSKNKRTQLHTAETEKYAHVTFFFNGGVENEYLGQKNILIPSPKVSTYDLQPEMSSQEVCDIVLLESQKYDFTVVNFANPDMLGHTGNMNACVATIEKLDTLISQIIEHCKAYNIALLLTADHGNCELLGTSEKPHTSHTTNPVPLWYIRDGEVQPDIDTEGDLTQIAPTILQTMSIDIPDEMNKNTLIK